jgi:hypothetical protein
MTAPATIAIIPSIIILPTLSKGEPEGKVLLDTVEFPAAEIEEIKIEAMITTIRYNFAIFYEKRFSYSVYRERE